MVAADRSTPIACAKAEHRMARNWLRAARKFKVRAPDKAARFIDLARQHRELARAYRREAALGGA